MQSVSKIARRGFSAGVHGTYRIPEVKNEPVYDYAPGSPERAQLKESLARMSKETLDIPCVVNGEEIREGEKQVREIPHDNKKTLCTFSYGSAETLKRAVDTAIETQKEWQKVPFQHRAAIWLKAADLIANKYRGDVLASTMMGQSKTVLQAEIDASVESIDFLRFDTKYAEELYSQQPISSPGVWNFSDHRPLEGFCLAISPFNFTAIGIHLPTAPALMGNTVVWKCSDAAIHSNYLMLKIFEEAGLPPGVINFVPADPSLYNDLVIPRPELAAVGFTGSTATFCHIWREVGKHITSYKGFPRLVGECGGKNFHLVHKTADLESVLTGSIRGAFEYQGQKCSATSRLYIPKSMWAELKPKMIEEVKKLRMGNVHEDMTTFMGAVIDERSFRKVKSYIDHAKNDKHCEIVVGGTCDDSKGWFVEPTVIETSDPLTKTMREEIFGPVLTVYPFDDNKFDEMPQLVDTTTPYSLTGSLFARDRDVIKRISEEMLHSVGNFYINDKSTGSVVANQPFGGSRSSGTNDKAGAMSFMSKWVSSRSTKETFNPLRGIDYVSMKPE